MGDNLEFTTSGMNRCRKEAVEAACSRSRAEDIHLWHFTKHLQAEREAVQGRP